MTKIWSLEDAQAHFQQLIKAARDEPQLITQGGMPLLTVQRAPATHPAPQTTLEAIAGDFDWSDLPDEELFERHPGDQEGQPRALGAHALGGAGPHREIW